MKNEHHAFVIAICFNENDNHFVAMAMVFLVSLGYHVQKLYPISWRYCLSVGFCIMLVTNSSTETISTGVAKSQGCVVIKFNGFKSEVLSRMVIPLLTDCMSI